MNESSKIRQLAVAGGAVDARKHIYITRADIENEIYNVLRNLDYCNILCSRQVGKTSLTFKIAMRLRDEGMRVVLLDVSSIGAPENPGVWFRDLLMQIKDQLRLQIDFREWWEQHEGDSYGSRILAFFKELVFADNIDAPVIVFVDEIDSTLKLPYADDFFTSIRAMYNQRSSHPQFEKVAFCLIGVATPNELIKDRRTTSYNVGRSVALRDFDLAKDDLRELEQVLSVVVSEPRQSLIKILHWTGGHPYLTVLLCRDVIESMKNASTIDDLVNRRFSSIKELRTDVHFEQILRFLNHRLSRIDETLDTYGQLLKGRPVEDTSTPALIELRLAGLVRQASDGKLLIRNPIYRKVFDWQWLQTLRPNRVRRRLKLIAIFSTVSFLLLLSFTAVFYLVNDIQPRITRDNLVEEVEKSLLADAVTAVSRTVGIPIPDNEPEIRTACERRINDEFESVLKEGAGGRDLKTAFSQMRSILQADPGLQEFLDKLVSQRAYELLRQADLTRNVSLLSDLIGSIQSKLVQFGLEAECQLRIRRFLQTKFDDILSNAESQKEVTVLLANLDKAFPNMNEFLAIQRADFEGRIASYQFVSLAEAISAGTPAQMGKSMVLTGELTVPNNLDIQPQINEVQKLKISLAGEQKGDRWIEFSVEILGLARVHRKIRIAIAVRDHRYDPLHDACDQIVDATAGDRIGFRISREGDKLKFSLGNHIIEHSMLFNDFLRSRFLVVDQHDYWAVDVIDSSIKYLPPTKIPTDMEMADRTFLSGEYRAAANLFFGLESRAEPGHSNPEATLKKTISIRRLVDESQLSPDELRRLLPNEEFGDRTAKEQLLLIWDRIGKQLDNPYASYALYLKLINRLESRGFFWTNDDRLEAAADLEHLRLLSSEQESRLVPAELWQKVIKVISGRAANQFEQVKLTKSDIETYKLLVGYCQPAPVTVWSKLLYRAADACLFVEDEIETSFEYSSKLVDSPYVRLSGLFSSVLYDYTWAATLLKRDDSAIAKINEIRNAIRWTPEFEARLDVLRARSLICTTETRNREEAERLLDSIIERSPRQNDASVTSFAQTVAEAYVLRGYAFRMQEKDEQEKDENAQRTWKRGFEWCIEKKVAESDISFVLLGSLSRAIDEKFVQNSFRKNVEGNAFVAGGMLLGLLSGQMKDISIAVRDMYSEGPGVKEVKRIILRTVGRDKYLQLQAELGMLHTIRIGAFDSAETKLSYAFSYDEDGVLALQMSHSGLNAFRAQKLGTGDMLNILYAWLSPNTAAPSNLPESVRFELSYILAHRLIKDSTVAHKDKARKLLDYASGSDSELTRTLANRSLSKLDSAAKPD